MPYNIELPHLHGTMVYIYASSHICHCSHSLLEEWRQLLAMISPKRNADPQLNIRKCLPCPAFKTRQDYSALRIMLHATSPRISPSSGQQPSYSVFIYPACACVNNVLLNTLNTIG